MLGHKRSGDAGTDDKDITSKVLIDPLTPEIEAGAPRRSAAPQIVMRSRAGVEHLGPLSKGDNADIPGKRRSETSCSAKSSVAT